jgi:hypothetical protein
MCKQTASTGGRGGEGKHLELKDKGKSWRFRSIESFLQKAAQHLLPGRHLKSRYNQLGLQSGPAGRLYPKGVTLI